MASVSSTLRPVAFAGRSASFSGYAAHGAIPAPKGNSEISALVTRAVGETIFFGVACWAALLMIKQMNLRRRERRTGRLLDRMADSLAMMQKAAPSKLEIKALQPCGAEVRGIDLGSEVPPETQSSLQAALREHGFLCFRGQDLLEKDMVRAVAIFAEPVRSSGSSLATRGKGLPLDVYRVCDRDRQLRGQDFWHSDNSYTNPPGGPTALYALTVPRAPDGKTLGDTLFADAAAAAKGLPQHLRSRTGGLVAAHNIAHNCGAGLPEFMSGKLVEAPDVLHPVLRHHPLTGRRCSS